MLPPLKTIDLPNPLPHADTLDVICYDFVPQILSMLQDKELMSTDDLAGVAVPHQSIGKVCTPRWQAS